MILLKFPKLHNALTKSVKDLDEDDPRRGVVVLSDNAIVFDDDFCIVCNLRDYFVLEQEIEDDNELEELSRILYYMNGKTFSKEFWNELTKGSHMSIQEGSLQIENPKFSKDLHYKEFDVDLIELLTQLVQAEKLITNSFDAISIPMYALDKIKSIMGSGWNDDNIVMEFTNQDTAVRFTFKKRKHFFGYIKPHYNSATEGFKFDTFNDFVNTYEPILEELKKEAMEKEKEAAAPPPPPEQNDDADNNQLKLVD